MPSDNGSVTDNSGIWDNPTTRAAILGGVIGTVVLVAVIIAGIIAKRCYDKRQKETPKNTNRSSENNSGFEDVHHYEIPMTDKADS